jgi:hypothetical protein
MRANCKDKKLKTLISATWFHGTRAVTSLCDTDFTLIPTGMLLQQGHLSFFGEMRCGCMKDGVNRDSLSGTYLDRVDWSIDSYAVEFEFDIDNEIKKTETFLDYQIDTTNKNFHTEFVHCALSLPGIELALKRWVRWDQEAFRQKMPALQDKLKYFKSIIKKIETKQPTEIFGWPDNYPDNYYSGKYESVVSSIAQIEAFLAAPLPAPLTERQKANIKGNFPAVLGSLTLFSQPYSYDDETGEHLVKGRVRMGRDLQLLCVNEQDKERAEAWKHHHLPDSNIEIFTFDQLHEAQEINKIISPYFADIFSKKKLEKLCTSV